MIQCARCGTRSGIDVGRDDVIPGYDGDDAVCVWCVADENGEGEEG